MINVLPSRLEIFIAEKL